MPIGTTVSPRKNRNKAMHRIIRRRCNCGRLVEQFKACPNCTPKQTKQKHQSLYNRRLWRDKIQPAKLAENPLCELCDKDGLVVSAVAVDHIEPHKGNWDLFVAKDNLQSLCAVCHGKKSARE